MLEPELVPINIGNINEGAMVEAFELELGQVLRNIADQKTPATATRSITLKLVLKPHADRVDIFATAEHKVAAPFQFDTYLDPEPFLISFRASFLFNENAVRIQQLCSTVSAGNAVNVADDGISQQITTVSGTVTRASVTLPAEGIPLIPWRTFRDANPVESKFLLRMKGVKDGLPKIALFEIDAFWKLDTVNAIAKYLRKELPDAIVIA